MTPKTTRAAEPRTAPNREAPATAAGRSAFVDLLREPPPSDPKYWRATILAIEAETSVPAAPLTAEALTAIKEDLWAMAYNEEADPFDEVWASLLARLPAAPAAPDVLTSDLAAALVERGIFGRGDLEMRLAAPAAPPPDEALRAALERLVRVGEDDGGLPDSEWREAFEQARAALSEKEEHEHVWDTWTSTVTIDGPTSEQSPLVRSCGICGKVRSEGADPHD